MSKRVIAVAAAAVLALVGTLVVIAYVRDADDRARADVEFVEVLVVEDPTRPPIRVDSAPLTAQDSMPSLEELVGTAQPKGTKTVPKKPAPKKNKKNRKKRRR